MVATTGDWSRADWTRATGARYGATRTPRAHRYCQPNGAADRHRAAGCRNRASVMGLTLALPLLLLGLLALWYAVKLRRSTGIPWARVVMQDTVGRTLERPLYARRYGL